MSSFVATLDLVSLTQDQGFAITRVNNGGELGFAVASAGDLNGDGYDDLVIGAPYANYSSDEDTGAAYVMFGGPDKNAPIVLSASTNVDGEHIFQMQGFRKFEHLGSEADGLGDVNGDGIDDMVVGGSMGEHVVFGTTDGFPAQLNYKTLDGSDGFEVTGAHLIQAAGDVNGDRVGDMMMLSTDGHITVLYGHAGDYAASLAVDPSTLTPEQGFSLAPQTDVSGFGRSSAPVGDVNGDGFDDLVVGAPGDPVVVGYYYDYNGNRRNETQDTPGKAYVIFGGASGPSSERMTIENLAPLHQATGDNVGAKVAAAGDFNGDGLADVFVQDTNYGVDYVVFGHSGAPPSTVDLNTIDGFNGVKITGADMILPPTIADIGDMNGDGFDDLAIGVVSENRTYVVFGQRAGASAVIDTSALNGENGFVLSGDGGAVRAGFSVSSAGDMNGDGLADLVVGAPDTESGGTGAAYVVWGQAPDGAVRRVGSSGSQHLVGGDDKDQLLGVGGDDSLYGGAAKDKLSGGAGKDVLIGGEGPDILTGGSGKDVFVFKSVAESPSGAPDVVTDLSSAQDRISLSGIDANSLVDGDQAFHRVAVFTGHAGDLVVAYHTDDQNAGYTTVKGDVDGDKVADFTLLVAGDHHDFSRFDL